MALRGGLVDGDAFVDGADVSIILASFGMTAGSLNGRQDSLGRTVDINSDGAVSGFDVSIAVSNMGQSSPQTRSGPSP